jgi:hypothetical protein
MKKREYKKLSSKIRLLGLTTYDLTLLLLNQTVVKDYCASHVFGQCNEMCLTEYYNISTIEQLNPFDEITYVSRALLLRERTHFSNSIVSNAKTLMVF